MKGALKALAVMSLAGLGAGFVRGSAAAFDDAAFLMSIGVFLLVGAWFLYRTWFLRTVPPADG